MELRDYIRGQISITHIDWEGALQDLTDEQFNWAPPGKCNSIAATVLHIFGIEDRFVQGKIKGEALVWEAGDWAKKLEVEELPDVGNG